MKKLAIVFGVLGTLIFIISFYNNVCSSPPPFSQTKIVDGDAAAVDCFGTSVSISGDTALVGAYQDDDAGSDTGSAYVFVRSGDTWTQQAKLTASDAAAGDYFGYSVSVSGDTALVGAPHDTGLTCDNGSTYVIAIADH